MIKRRPLDAKDLLASQNLRRIWFANHRRLGLTQESAAAALGFAGQSAVSQYINGRIPLNTEAVLKFARLLGVAPEDIDPRVGSLLPPAAATGIRDTAGLYRTLTPVQRDVLNLLDGLTAAQQAALIEQMRSMAKTNDDLLRQLLDRAQSSNHAPP